MVSVLFDYRKNIAPQVCLLEPEEAAHLILSNREFQEDMVGRDISLLTIKYALLRSFNGDYLAKARYQYAKANHVDRAFLVDEDAINKTIQIVYERTKSWDLIL